MEAIKRRSIGKVILDYSFFSGENYYSDGPIEDRVLNIIRHGKAEENLHNSNEWAFLYHLSDIRENVIEWCHISNEDSVLEIGSGCGAITGILSKKAKVVTCVELSEKRSLINAERNKEKDNIKILLGNFQDLEPSLGKYDVITLIGVLEYAKFYIKSDNPYIEMLSLIKKHLNENGKLIIAIENKMGLKYINGAPEDHIGQPYVGINDYVLDDGVRTFSHVEIETMLNITNYINCKFYYPVPDYKLPISVYSSEYLPKPGNIRTYRTNYSKSRLYNFYEDVVSDQLAYDEMFGYMANSFVVTAGCISDDDVVFAKYNRERRKEFRVSTIIRKKNNKYIVEKCPLNTNAFMHVANLKKNEDLWCVPNEKLNKVEGVVTKDGIYRAPYILGKTLDEIMYSYRFFSEDFVKMVKKFLDLYFTVSENFLLPFEKTEDFVLVFGNLDVKDAKCCKVTNIDMLFSNIIIDAHNNAFVFDYEWVFDFPIPYQYISWRAAKEIYYKYLVYLKGKLSVNEYYNNLGFSDSDICLYNKMEKSFGEYVCGKDRCEVYTDNYIKPSFMPTMVIG